MPHKPNYEEFAGAGQKAQKDATELYDSTYGRYEDEACRDDKTTRAPPAQPDPVKISGS